MHLISKQPRQSTITFAVLGHHKSVSTYIRHVSRTTCRLLGVRFKAIYFGDTLPFGYHLQKDYSKNYTENINSILYDRYDMLFHANASNNVIETLEKRGKYRSIHLIRDPRDIIVSGYFSHLYSHPLNSPWFVEQHYRLQKLNNIEKGLLAEIDFNSCFIESIGTWNYANPNIYEMCFERLVENPLDEISVAFDFLGLLEKKISKSRMGFISDLLQRSGVYLASSKLGVFMDLTNRFLPSRVCSQQ